MSRISTARRRRRILAGADVALVARQAQEQLHDLLAFEQLHQVRPLVAGDIGAEDQHDQLQAFVAQLAADHRLDLARHVLHEIHGETGEVIGDLVDRQFGVQGHAAKKWLKG